MPPEQFGGRGRSTAGDLWALGVLSYELLVGEPGPFEADDVGEASPTRLRCFDRSASPQQKVEAYAGAGAAAKREAIRRRVVEARPERGAAHAADLVVGLLTTSEAEVGRRGIEPQASRPAATPTLLTVSGPVSGKAPRLRELRLTLRARVVRWARLGGATRAAHATALRAAARSTRRPYGAAAR